MHNFEIEFAPLPNELKAPTKPVASPAPWGPDQTHAYQVLDVCESEASANSMLGYLKGLPDYLGGRVYRRPCGEGVWVVQAFIGDALGSGYYAALGELPACVTRVVVPRSWLGALK
jgi:hypothetical protein